jgi:hypothetical protein
VPVVGFAFSFFLCALPCACHRTACPVPPPPLPNLFPFPLPGPLPSRVHAPCVIGCQICIGGVCIPLTAVIPAVLLFLKAAYSRCCARRDKGSAASDAAAKKTDAPQPDVPAGKSDSAAGAGGSSSSGGPGAPGARCVQSCELGLSVVHVFFFVWVGGSVCHLPRHCPFRLPWADGCMVHRKGGRLG